MFDEMEKPVDIDPQRLSILLEEYQAAHSSFHHYDAFRWQSGSMIISGALVLWGFLLSKDPGANADTIYYAGALISGLMACWLLFAHHYRQLYMSKLRRIHEIEGMLGMDLNRRHGFLGSPPSWVPKSGPAGHHLDVAVFAIISLFGPAVTIFQTKTVSNWFVFVAPLIVLITSLAVGLQEKAMRRKYSALNKTIPLSESTALQGSAMSSAQIGNVQPDKEDAELNPASN